MPIASSGTSSSPFVKQHRSYRHLRLTHSTNNSSGSTTACLRSGKAAEATTSLTRVGEGTEAAAIKNRGGLLWMNAHSRQTIWTSASRGAS